MQTRPLGNTDLQMTPLIFGTWQAGKRGWVGVEDAALMDAMRAAFEAGITTFDTAEIYGEGYSEELVGKALGDVRDRILLATNGYNSIDTDEGLAVALDAKLLLGGIWISPKPPPPGRSVALDLTDIVICRCCCSASHCRGGVG